jgi:predicted nucleotidyltransferase
MNNKYLEKFKKHCIANNYIKELLNTPEEFAFLEETETLYDLNLLNEIIENLNTHQKDVLDDLINRTNQTEMAEKYNKKNANSMKTYVYFLRKVIKEKYFKRELSCNSL